MEEFVTEVWTYNIEGH